LHIVIIVVYYRVLTAVYLCKI